MIYVLENRDTGTTHRVFHIAAAMDILQRWVWANQRRFLITVEEEVEEPVLCAK